MRAAPVSQRGSTMGIVATLAMACQAREQASLPDRSEPAITMHEGPCTSEVKSRRGKREGGHGPRSPEQMDLNPRPYRSEDDWQQMMALLTDVWRGDGGLQTVEPVGSYRWWRRSPGWEKTL